MNIDARKVYTGKIACRAATALVMLNATPSVANACAVLAIVESSASNVKQKTLKLNHM